MPERPLLAQSGHLADRWRMAAFGVKRTFSAIPFGTDRWRTDRTMSRADRALHGSPAFVDTACPEIAETHSALVRIRSGLFIV
jgi:hypothetical protein